MLFDIKIIIILRDEFPASFSFSKKYQNQWFSEWNWIIGLRAVERDLSFMILSMRNVENFKFLDFRNSTRLFSRLNYEPFKSFISRDFLTNQKSARVPSANQSANYKNRSENVLKDDH